MTLLRFERRTYCLEGSCSIQLSYKTLCFLKNLLFEVGMAGFEPATSCSQSRRDNRTTLHPVLSQNCFLRRRGDSNPRYPNRVRQFSKLLVSATHPPLRLSNYVKFLSNFGLQKYYFFPKPPNFFSFLSAPISLTPDLQHFAFCGQFLPDRPKKSVFSPKNRRSTQKCRVLL